MRNDDIPETAGEAIGVGAAGCLLMLGTLTLVAVVVIGIVALGYSIVSRWWH